MYYVLFHYIKKKGMEGMKDWIPCSIESRVIQFLHESDEDIQVDQIIEVKGCYRLGLIETDEYIKSSLVLEEEPESLVQLGRKSEEILKKKKLKLKELEAEEPSAMEKIIDETEEEMTDEEKDKKTMDKADRLIQAGKESMKKEKNTWDTCPKCKKNKIAPWNKKGICSTCQNKRKTDRPYGNKEFTGL